MRRPGLVARQSLNPALVAARLGFGLGHEPGNFARLTGIVESMADRAWVDKLPTPVFFNLRRDLEAVLDVHTSGDKDLEYPWGLLREHLHACHLYMSPNEILIRPIVAPTWTHPPFAGARHRIYMSATLGAGGDLERMMGRKSIKRIAVPEGWDRQGVGRCFFIFPEMSLKPGEVSKLRRDLMQRAGRSLVRLIAACRPTGCCIG